VPVSIRLEKVEDFRETEILTREAFWNIYKPGCDEHLVVHKLRTFPAFVEELDFVATEEEQIIGNIMYSKARVLGENGAAREVLCLGPVSVLPSQQGRGIGGGLIQESLSRARGLGFTGVFLFGNPAYYARFGFRNAKEFGVLDPEGNSHDYFMGIELAPGRLSGTEGRLFYDEVFHVDSAEVDEFEKLFPHKEKGPAKIPLG
jgi:predicted N-acetyltransferase YhbS